MKGEKKVRVTFLVEPAVKEYMRQQAQEKHDFRYLSPWIRACLEASYVAQDITDRIAQAVEPTAQYVQRQELLLLETPPAFLVPFGPVPALERRLPVEPSLPMPEEAPPSPEPPVIELLPGSNPGSYWTHIVQPGDSLSSIAAKYYGTPGRYMRIAKANNIRPPYVIYVGQQLVVPKPELATSALKVFSSGCHTWCTHTVQPGETLRTIAEHYYGNGNEYWRIANCNNVLPPNYTIYVGDTLSIPARVL